ncbi:MAG: hypothetical protein ACLRNQ_22005 [Flavonifractor plautii]
MSKFQVVSEYQPVERIPADESAGSPVFIPPGGTEFRLDKVLLRKTLGRRRAAARFCARLAAVPISRPVR